MTQRGFVVAMGRNKNPSSKNSIAELPVFLSAANLKQYVDKELERSSEQIRFHLPKGSGGLGGNIALGYRAELLPQVCSVYLRAKFEAIRYCLHEFGVRVKLELLLAALLEGAGGSHERIDNAIHAAPSASDRRNHADAGSGAEESGGPADGGVPRGNGTERPATEGND